MCELKQNIMMSLIAHNNSNTMFKSFAVILDYQCLCHSVLESKQNYSWSIVIPGITAVIFWVHPRINIQVTLYIS